MTYPKASDDSRHAVARLIDTFVARSQRGLKIRGERVKSDLMEIAADDLQSNYAGVRQAYLATLRLRIDTSVYEDLLDGPLYVIADSAELDELAQSVADDASNPDAIDGEALNIRLTAIAQEDLGAGVRAARGAFLASLESKLPHRGDAYDTLLAGPLSFLMDSQ